MSPGIAIGVGLYYATHYTIMHSGFTQTHHYLYPPEALAREAPPQLRLTEVVSTDLHSRDKHIEHSFTPNINYSRGHAYRFLVGTSLQV